ncbi:MAG: PSD1 domain-containing protein [Planctomycetales bacterium]|nr:PSD1 domain-containing protein [Planctomycetales bacterium]
MATSLSVPIAVSSDEVPDQSGSQYFETEIRPIFAKHCFQCHSERAQEIEGGLLLDQRSAWLAGGDRGPAVDLEMPEASLLIKAVRYDEPDLAMPPATRLSDADIRRLEHWVRIGAPGPLDGRKIHVENPADPVAGKKHWAFQPIERVPLPCVSDPSWPQGAIDCFILAKLDQAGIKPVTDAEDCVLERRLAFQLHGLPPTSEHRIASTFDHQQAVDYYLSSPQYGQRWGRHWLDLARYADSNGLDENFLFREAWRYRNWVINATNDDIPFDQFLLQQLAGDLLPYDSIEQRDQQRIAAGFLVIGPKVLLGVPSDQQRMDIADEQIDTIGRAILAQTLGCARCHDHKFAPFPTADYYAMAGIFTSTRVMENRRMLGQQRDMEQLIGIGPNGEQRDDEYEAYWRDHSQLKARKDHAAKVLELLKSGDDQAFAKYIDEHGDSASADAKDQLAELSVRIASQQAFLDAIADSLEHPPEIPPRAMSPADRDVPVDEAIRLAGQFDALGDVVQRGFLSVLEGPTTSSWPAEQSGRIQLAQWLTKRDTAASYLTARVLANRVWQRLMGRGLVRTVDNFGRTGEQPSHPELLDYLASQLILSGWSTKELVREIVSSRTFALSSTYNAEYDQLDPDNRLYWRANRIRLDPESMRDAMLFAAGHLDNAQYLSTVDYLGDQATAVGANKVRRRTDFRCRSVYLPVIRNDLPEIFEAFDFADPHRTTGERPKTIVPSQSLYLMNDEMVMATAETTADRILETQPGCQTAQHVESMFDMVLQAAPTPAELEAVVSYIETVAASDQSKEPAAKYREALASACHALFASSRFQVIE